MLFHLFFFFLAMAALVGTVWSGKTAGVLLLTSGMGHAGAVAGYLALAVVCFILLLAFGLAALGT